MFQIACFFKNKKNIDGEQSVAAVKYIQNVLDLIELVDQLTRKE